jgi:hypothetical protein
MRYITVPKTIDAMKKLDCDNNLDGDLDELILDDTDFYKIFSTGIFNDINLALDILIDDYEDEKIIGKEKLKRTKIIIENYFIKNSKINIIEKFLILIESAIEYDTGIYFNF